MKKDELLDAIGDIDERYVRQASENEDRKKNPKPWAAVAACLFLAALGLVSVWFLRERLQSQRHGEHGSAEYGEAETSGTLLLLILCTVSFESQGLIRCSGVKSTGRIPCFILRVKKSLYERKPLMTY